MRVQRRLETMGDNFDTAEPDVVLLKSADLSVNEMALWYAVLKLAVSDAKGRIETNYRYREQIKADAIAWIKSDSGEVGSLRWILGHTRINATVGAIRQAALGTAA